MNNLISSQHKSSPKWLFCLLLSHISKGLWANSLTLFLPCGISVSLVIKILCGEPYTWSISCFNILHSFCKLLIFKLCKQCVSHGSIPTYCWEPYYFNFFNLIYVWLGTWLKQTSTFFCTLTAPQHWDLDFVKDFRGVDACAYIQRFGDGLREKEK